MLIILAVTPQYVDIKGTIFSIVTIAASLVGGICAFAFLRAGILWAANNDNPSNASRARSALEGGIIGAIVCASAITLTWLLMTNISYQAMPQQPGDPFTTPSAVVTPTSTQKP